ncbi:amidohydrolase family protein [Alistipes sp. ZOR0009]|uniref:amidohydrolase family protein n=1 Tax=Alistipes sp. ZOR0009 TaxID=1339253 RepID=UPI0006476DA7|nr:amidohydrolase family protein [Alistipes sp. ZOR0009]
MTNNQPSGANNALKSISDYHFHAFNKDVLTVRTIYLIIRALLNRNNASPTGTQNKSTDFLEELLRIRNFLHIGFQENSIDVFNILLNDYKQKGYVLDTAIPLMFDVEYCFIEATSQGETNIHDRVISDLKNRFSLLKEESNNEDFGAIQNFLNTLNIDGDDVLSFADITTRSFENQLNDIKSLKTKYPTTIYPFFAVDPRRPNVVQMAKNAIESKNFFGIKIYAPNGYSPLDPTLLPLYDYCQQHSIPITAHHSLGGFASFANSLNIYGKIYRNGAIVDPQNPVQFEKLFSPGWIEDRANTLNHPKLWEQVLLLFPELRLNLAHFGIFSDANTIKDRYSWTDYVAGLMKTFPNLYTDLSCYTSTDDLKYINNHYLNDPIIGKKILYGSDFYLNMLFIDNFKQYLTNFTNILGPNFDKIVVNNQQFFAKQPAALKNI